MTCPECNGQAVTVNVKRSGQRRYLCKACGHRYTVQKPAKAHSGSGQVAGAITIGKGTRWGAGY